MSYVEILKQEFEELLDRQGYKWKLLNDSPYTKENVYLIDCGEGIGIKIYSSIVGSKSRDVGADAVRIIGWDSVSNLPIGYSESRVYRTTSWRENLIDRIENVKEKMKNVQKCKICGGVMVERENKTTRQKFMGCLGWKNHGIKRNEVKDEIKEMKLGISPAVLPKCTVGLNADKDYIDVKGDEKLLETKTFKWGKFNFDKFNPIQSRVIEFVEGDNNVVVQARTSTGKTEMGEMFMWYILGLGKKVIYTSPLKALTREKWDSWSKKFGEGGGYKISIITGDYRLTEKRIKELNEADIILCTSEMLDHRTRNIGSEKSEWIKEAGLLILDEIQMIGMEGRGDKFEAGLMRFTLVNPSCRLVLLSGTMPNSVEISGWISELNGKKTILVKSDWRPIKLNMKCEGYKDVVGFGGYYASKEKLFEKVIEVVNRYGSEKILIFVHSKVDGRSIKGMLEGMGYSVEFHNADLDTDERIMIEKSFKDREEGVRIIIATSTLAYGLNLPARIVIISGAHRGLEEVNELDIIQMCGRSGRMGIDNEGDAIMIFPESGMEELRRKVENPGDIISQINNPLIAGFHVIGEIVGGMIKNREDVYKWWGRTLASRQNIKINKEYIDGILNYLIENRAIIEYKDGLLKETELGKACVYFYLRPDMLKDLIDNWNKIFRIGVEGNDFMVTLALSKLRMYERVIVSKIERVEIENYLRGSLGVENIFGEILEGQAKIGTSYLNMLKGIGGVKEEIVEGGKKKKIGNPLISIQRGLRQDVERIFQSLAYLDARYCGWRKGNFWSIMGLRIKYGIGPELVGLCSLEGIGGTYAKRLWNEGIKNPVDLITKKKEAIMVLGARYDGIIERNKEFFSAMGYNINQIGKIVAEVSRKDVLKKESLKKEKIDDDNILKFP